MVCGVSVGSEWCVSVEGSRGAFCGETDTLLVDALGDEVDEEIAERMALAAETK